TLNDTSNDADTIDLRARNAADGADAAGAISFVDADGVDIAKISTTSPATVTAGDAILVSGSISAGGSTATLTAAGDITINANITDSMAIDAHSGTDGTGDVTFGAGVTLDAPTINLRSGDGPGGAANAEVDIMTNTPTIIADTLTIQHDGQMGDSVTPWNPNVTNNASIDLILLSDESSIYTTDADSWQSITAEAKDNIELSGSGDIKIAATGLLSHEGGVKVISDGGSIYTPGAGDTLNAPITGYSDEEGGVGVDLPFAEWAPLGTGTKAAIVIQSKSQDLKLGPDATLTANGTYNPLDVDDRGSVAFVNGNPIDVAIYLGSFSVSWKWPPDWWLIFNGANVEMGSGSVSIDNKSGIGTLVIDAYDTVTFTNDFETSLQAIRPDNVRRLEVVSRKSPDLTTAIVWETLPHAMDPGKIAGGFFNGTYVLRGEQELDLFWFIITNSAKLLDWSDPVPLVPPKLTEPEEQGEVEEPDTDALIALLEELGIGVQPYLASAYRHERSGINTLNTDLRLFKAAEKLQKLIPVLEDTEGQRISALRVVVGQFFSTLASISDEQMASFRQELARHVDDGTDYDLAGQTIASLTDYVEILSTDIGWPTDRSMAFVMGRYIPRLTEGDAIRTAVVQIQLQEALGM
nr:hypothetical protein [Phycisphaerae bacterium]NIP53163.1 hypothetical protein [Phycisphaerae bacterium]NIS52194.1 hypothetical protein [Phycisphaerae bacterium]NIU09728.1 hypothetical protein [Phycisphaerae bacterium]NIU57400.1 hypothetical protein [Phycisphaerae bacterium]